MSTALAELFRHNLWANLRLIDLCATLKDAQLDAAAPGTYGRARDTLVHIVAAEGRYVTLLTGRRPEQPLREDAGFPGFAALRERAQASGEELVAVAAQAQSTRVLTGTWRDKPYALPITVPLIQAINHGTEHRAHIVTILSQHGVEPPALDGWAYGREVLEATF